MTTTKMSKEEAKELEKMWEKELNSIKDYGSPVPERVTPAYPVKLLYGGRDFCILTDGVGAVFGIYIGHFGLEIRRF